MTMFPDCRNDDNYNERFLNKEDRDAVFGFDCCRDSVLNFIEHNLDVYEYDLNEVLEEGEECPKDEIYSKTEGLYKILEANKELLANIIAEWLEMERDEWITSMLDSMEEEDYTKNKVKALEENSKLEKPHKFYDTKYFVCTGKKLSSDETAVMRLEKSIKWAEENGKAEMAENLKKALSEIKK